MPITRAEQIRALAKEVAYVREQALNQRKIEIAIDAKWDELCDQEYLIDKPIVSKYTERRDKLREIIATYNEGMLKYFDEYAPFTIQFGTIPTKICRDYMKRDDVQRLKDVLVQHHTEWW